MKYSGTLRIRRVDPSVVKTPRTYVVTFAPGSMAMISNADAVEAEWVATFWHGIFKDRLKPHTIHGDEKLTALLAGLEMPQEASNSALEELHQQGSASIAPAVLSDKQLSRSGLLWTVGAKILSYLSALTR
jgi:hypothetical protein